MNRSEGLEIQSTTAVCIAERLYRTLNEINNNNNNNNVAGFWVFRLNLVLYSTFSEALSCSSRICFVSLYMYPTVHSEVLSYRRQLPQAAEHQVVMLMQSANGPRFYNLSVLICIERE